MPKRERDREKRGKISSINLWIICTILTLIQFLVDLACDENENQFCFKLVKYKEKKRKNTPAQKQPTQISNDTSFLHLIDKCHIT